MLFITELSQEAEKLKEDAEEEERLQAWLMPLHQQDEPAEKHQPVSYILAAPSLPPSKSATRDSLVAHPNLKHKGEGILGNVGQSRQVDILQSSHTPYSLFSCIKGAAMFYVEKQNHG